MKTRDIKKYIDKAIDKYVDFQGICDLITHEAKKHIDWTDSVFCDYYPSDGICLAFEYDDYLPYVVPATTFFTIAKAKNGSSVSIDEIREMAI